MNVFEFIIGLLMGIVIGLFIIILNPKSKEEPYFIVKTIESTDVDKRLKYSFEGLGLLEYYSMEIYRPGDTLFLITEEQMQILNEEMKSRTINRILNR